VLASPTFTRRTLRVFSVVLAATLLSGGTAGAASQNALTGVRIGSGRATAVVLKFSRDPAYQAFSAGATQVRIFNVVNAGAPASIAVGGETLRLAQHGADLDISGLSSVALTFVRGRNTLTIITTSRAVLKAAIARSRATIARQNRMSKTSITTGYFVGEATRLVAAERHSHLDHRTYPSEPFRVLSQAAGPRIVTNRFSTGPTVSVTMITHGAVPHDPVVATRMRTLTFDRATGVLLGEVDALATAAQAKAASYPVNPFGGP